MTERLEALLAGRLAPGVYRLRARTAARRLGALAQEHGWRFYPVDAGAVTGKQEFIAACAAGLGFPAYTGHNWDAFEEVVNEYPRVEGARGHFVLLDHLGRFAAAAPRELATALDVLESAAENRRGEAAPLAVLVRGGRRVSARLPEIG